MRPFLLVPLVLISSFALAETPLAIARRLVEAERKPSLTMNAAWYEKNEAPGYVAIGTDGKRQTKAQEIANMRRRSKTVKISSLTANTLDAKMAGKDLVIRLKVHALGSVTDPQGKVHAIEGTETVEDTWTKIGGDWRKRRERILTETVKIDGKVVPQR